MNLGVILALILEVIRLINRAGGAEKALATVREINQTFDALKEAKTPPEMQNAAEKLSRDISGDK
jgi:hypothetical protein